MINAPKTLFFLRPATLAAAAGLAFSGLAHGQIQRDFTVVADAMVDSIAATSNRGSLDEIFVINSGTTGSEESFIRFDLTAIPRTATVLGASLTYQVTEVSALAPTISFGLVEEQWIESGVGGITFATRPKVTRELLEHTPTVGRHRVLANVELLAAIRGWVRQPSANAGLRLLVTNGATGVKTRLAGIVARESAGNGRTAATLRVQFVDVQITTQSLPVGVVGIEYQALIEARIQGASFVQWRLLDTLPAGFNHRVVDGKLEIFGRPVRVGNDTIRVEARDPASGAKHVRSLQLRVAPARGEVTVVNGSSPTGASFDSSDPRPLVVLSPRITNDTTDIVALQSLAFMVAGSADNIRDLATIELFEDLNGDGVVDPADLRVAGPASLVRDGGSVVLDLNDVRFQRAAAKQFLVVITPRLDCPRGVEFAVAMVPGHGGQRADMVGSDRPARISFPERLEGPSFVSGQPEPFDGDANEDGVIDCLDAQILALRLGSASNGGADPDGNGLIDRTDIELLTDLVLGRPVITRLSILRGRVGFSRDSLVLLGFGLGKELDPTSTECTINGAKRFVLISTARITVISSGSLPAGEHRLRLAVGAARSRELIFVKP
jgi:mRNA-degrading endonuclease toxin of MazEF toxin-antitoxin module